MCDLEAESPKGLDLSKVTGKRGERTKARGSAVCTAPHLLLQDLVLDMGDRGGLSGKGAGSQAGVFAFSNCLHFTRGRFCDSLFNTLSHHKYITNSVAAANLK